MRTIGGIPMTTWALGVIAGVIGFVWMRSRTKTGAATGQASGTPTFTQQQETADFQIFSALTGAQQASDLNFLGEVASLFAGGGSPSPSSTTTPSPPSTGTAPPTTQGLTNQQLTNIGKAESQAEVQAAGGNPLVAMSNLGLNQSQVQNLGAAVAAGGGNFLAENMAAEQAGLPYYNSAGQVVG